MTGSTAKLTLGNKPRRPTQEGSSRLNRAIGNQRNFDETLVAIDSNVLLTEVKIRVRDECTHAHA